ncbi:MAG: restriction endonuclease subunit S [Flavobacteriales bacterium]|nr:restriction endonuclease subunit S [Flavobacteriales bacterium]
MGNIKDGELIFDKLKYCPSTSAEIAKYELKDGDVLFNRTNSPELVGKSAIYRSAYPKAVFASYLIRLTVDKAVCDPDWLNYYMNSPQQRYYIKSVVTQQVGQANVNGTKMKAMPLPLPSIKMQRKLVKEISTRLSRANEMMAPLDAQLLQSTRLRQAVLKRAFEGRLS